MFETRFLRRGQRLNWAIRGAVFVRVTHRRRRRKWLLRLCAGSLLEVLGVAWMRRGVLWYYLAGMTFVARQHVRVSPRHGLHPLHAVTRHIRRRIYKQPIDTEVLPSSHWRHHSQSHPFIHRPLNPTAASPIAPNAAAPSKPPVVLPT